MAKNTTKYRGAIAFPTNPFVLPEMLANQTVKKRILANQTGGMMVVNKEDQSEIAPISGFWAAEIVDSGKFVKLYKKGVRAFSGLSSAGFKVFEILYDQVQDSIGKGFVIMNYKMLDTTVYPLSEHTFQRGIRELIEKNFIARQPMDHLFWINPDFIFNGDRLAFVTEYFRENSQAAREYVLKKREVEASQNQPELPLEPAV